MLFFHFFSCFSEHNRDYGVSCGVRSNGGGGKANGSSAPRGAAVQKSGAKNQSTDGLGIVILDTGMGTISS